MLLLSIRPHLATLVGFNLPCIIDGGSLPNVGRVEWAANGPQQDGNSPFANPNIGGLFSASPETASVWSFSQKESV
ncbi:hypothetical protein GW17_00005166 [Ensete ventricosum]|nr:hypothetical protein GW17_00005166 [Ensete ventricosum]